MKLSGVVAKVGAPNKNGDIFTRGVLENFASTMTSLPASFDGQPAEIMDAWVNDTGLNVTIELHSMHSVDEMKSIMNGGKFAMTSMGCTIEKL